jgi:hypothetical protein
MLGNNDPVSNTNLVSGTRFVLEYMIIITQHIMSGTMFVLEYMIIITQHSMSRTRFVLDHVFQYKPGS